MSTKQQRFIKLFLLILAITFSPYTSVGQVAPLVFVAGMLFYVRARPQYHILQYARLLLIYTSIGFLYWALMKDEFSWVGFFLNWVTLSSFLVLSYDFRSLVSARLLRRIGTITLTVIGGESIYGIAQAVGAYIRMGTFDKSAGDYVWGTVAPYLDASYSGRMPTFVLALSTLLIFCVAVSPPRISARRLLFGYGPIVLCWLLSSLLHSYIYFFAALGIALVLIWRRRRKTGLAAALAVTGAFAILGLLLLPENMSNIPFVISNAIDISADAKYHKMRVVGLTLRNLPQRFPPQPIVGLGPGQYASRAALMLSGKYLSRNPIPFLPIQLNSYTEDFIVPYLGVIKSSLHFPSSSWLATYGETGILGLTAVLAVILKSARRFKNIRATPFPRMSLAMLVMLFYIILMGIQNVYWEYTQGIFPAIVTGKLCYDYARALQTKHEPDVRANLDSAPEQQ